MFNQVRFYFKARPLLNRLQELSQMKLTTNVAWQIVGTFIQLGNQASDVVSPKYRPFVAFLTGVLQLAVAYFAHQSNPDGTSAAVAYEKKK